jgi:acetyltransferase
MDFAASGRKVAALMEPRSVAIVGATDRPGSYGARAWDNLCRYGFPGRVFPINPRRAELWGQKCYPDLAACPEPPDHLLILVPAPAVIAALKSGAAAGARSASVLSAGFGEADNAAGAALGRELAEVIAQTGLAVSGPNCLGNFCAKSRLVTLLQDQPLELKPGPVAIVAQSGGVAIFANRALEERGIAVGYAISSGNEAGLTSADYIAYFAHEPDVKMVLCYLEAVHDAERFKAACALAQDAGKPVVAIKLGATEAGRQAALAHTGALAGSTEIFDAVAGELGVMRVDAFDDAIDAIELVVHGSAPAGRRLGAVTLSGAFRGMLIDGAARHGLSFPPLAPETLARLNKLLSVGALVGNPLDGGFGVLSSDQVYIDCIDAIAADPGIDALLIQEELPRRAGASDRQERYLRLIEDYVATRAQKPVYCVTMFSHSQSAYSRALRAELPHVPILQEADRALRTIAHVVRRAEREALARAAAPVAASASAATRAAVARLREDAASSPDAVALNEVRAKELLAAYGIATPPEALVSGPAEAVEAAGRIGYPVVLKAVSARLAHKSDVGAVALNLADAASVRAAYDRILRNLARHGIEAALDGMLVAKHIEGGIELALGVHRDREMGLVVMAGSGGVLLELVHDVAFCAPPVTPAKALDLLARTRVARLLQPWRGRAAHDLDAVVRALTALGAIALECGDLVQSIDINPFLSLPGGGVALDALVVLRRES